MVVRYFTTKILPAIAVGACAVTVFTSTAQAFFPPILIGSNEVITTPPAPVIPVTPVVPVIPPPPPPPFVSPPTTVPPICNCPAPPVVRPSEVPEPATMALGGIGLAVAGAGMLRKKLKKVKPQA